MCGHVVVLYLVVYIWAVLSELHHSVKLSEGLFGLQLIYFRIFNTFDRLIKNEIWVTGFRIEVETFPLSGLNEFEMQIRCWQLITSRMIEWLHPKTVQVGYSVRGHVAVQVILCQNLTWLRNSVFLNRGLSDKNVTHKWHRWECLSDENNDENVCA